MKTVFQLPKGRVELLEPADVQTYLLAHGWEEEPSGSPAPVGTYRYGPDREVTVLVPRDRAFGDYALRIGDVLHTLAVLANRPIWEMLDALLAQHARPAANGSAIRRTKTKDGPPATRGKKGAS
jgi:hypothetical protein